MLRILRAVRYAEQSLSDFIFNIKYSLMEVITMVKKLKKKAGTIIKNYSTLAIVEWLLLSVSLFTTEPISSVLSEFARVLP